VSAPSSGRIRTRRLALLWLVAAAAGCGALLYRAAALDDRIAWEVDVRDDVREGMASYDLRDSASWQAGQRRVDTRIAALRRERGVMLGLVFAMGALAVAPIAWVTKPWRRHSRATSTRATTPRPDK